MEVREVDKKIKYMCQICLSNFTNKMDLLKQPEECLMKISTKANLNYQRMCLA